LWRYETRGTAKEVGAAKVAGATEVVGIVFLLEYVLGFKTLQEENTSR